MGKGRMRRHDFGTAPVYFTAVSTILGAILFLRFGWAVGTIGFYGVLLLLLLAYTVAIPTSMALSEIASNEKVEGGGEYYIISRSFGLNIGATIGLSLFLSQSIGVGFYIIAFTEAFEPLFDMVAERYGLHLPRQAVSLPAMTLLAVLILTRGANLGVKSLYLIAGILGLSLLLFFLGKTEYSSVTRFTPLNGMMRNMDDFFLVFAIVFPAFTGMNAGVGLSGDLKNPARSIPRGTISATLTGMVVYFFVSWKLAGSATPEDLVGKQLIMADIALWGKIAIPVGLAASTISSALGSIMVAPRTLQALAKDRSFPSGRLNRFLSRGKGEANEPFHASLVVICIAFAFVALGSVNIVARIISMFFMVTYCSLCLISFLYHFGGDPSYRPSFRSRWYISLTGFLMSLYLMFRMNAIYSLVALTVLVIVYTMIRSYHKDRQGLEAIFQSVIFQLSRNLQVYLQKSKKLIGTRQWRPAVVCISKSSFERDNALRLVNWLSYRYGFGTYIHLVEGYYSRSTSLHSKEVLVRLIEASKKPHSNVYLDTLISPSYTTAIAQVIQLPSVSGMENNMIILEFSKDDPAGLRQITENYSLMRSGSLDTCILGTSGRKTDFSQGVHVWLRGTDRENSVLLIMLSHIILHHPDWKEGNMKIFRVISPAEKAFALKSSEEILQSIRPPMDPRVIELIEQEEEVSLRTLVNRRSARAGLTVVGFRGEQLKREQEKLFLGYDRVGDILFVNAGEERDI